jgi:hypothetical protein
MGTIQDLQRAVEQMHSCQAKHVGSETVKEVFRGKTVWQGIVETFEPSGHPQAKRCYAWGHLEGDKDERTRFVVVLELPPVDSARKAVRVAIVSRAKT